MQAITDSIGTTLVEAVSNEVHIDVNGNRKLSITDNFSEVSSILIPDTNLGRNIGDATRQFNQVYQGTAGTSFVGDNLYTVGTVMKAGGPNEVTSTTTYADPTVIGVVMFDDGTTNTSIATSGKAICQVEGAVAKGDLLTSSNTTGVATVLNPIDYVPGCVIGKALQDFPGPAGNINIFVSVF